MFKEKYWYVRCRKHVPIWAPWFWKLDLAQPGEEWRCNRCYTEWWAVKASRRWRRKVCA